MVRELVKEQNNGIQVIMRLQSIKYQNLFCFNMVERIVMACSQFAEVNMEINTVRSLKRIAFP